MSADIPAYDKQTPVPWNPDSGKTGPIGPVGSEELAFGTDIRSDPADADGSDPNRGFDAPGTRVSRI